MRMADFELTILVVKATFIALLVNRMFYSEEYAETLPKIPIDK